MPTTGQTVPIDPDPYHRSQVLVKVNHPASSDRSYLGIPNDDGLWFHQQSVHPSSSQGSWETVSVTSHSESYCMVENGEGQQLQFQQSPVPSISPSQMNLSPLQTQQAAEATRPPWPYYFDYSSGLEETPAYITSQPTQVVPQPPFSAVRDDTLFHAGSYGLGVNQNVMSESPSRFSHRPDHHRIMNEQYSFQDLMVQELAEQPGYWVEPPQPSLATTDLPQQHGHEEPSDQPITLPKVRTRARPKYRKQQTAAPRAKRPEVFKSRRNRKTNCQRKNIKAINAVRERKACMYCRLLHEQVNSRHCFSTPTIRLTILTSAISLTNVLAAARKD